MRATEHRPAQSRWGDPSQRGEVNSSPAIAQRRTGVFCPSVAEQSPGPIGPNLVRCGASSESKDGVAEGQLDSIETNSKQDAPTLPERVKRSRSKAARSVAWQERQRLVNRETGEMLADEDGNPLTLADVAKSWYTPRVSRNKLWQWSSGWIAPRTLTPNISRYFSR